MKRPPVVAALRACLAAYAASLRDRQSLSAATTGQRGTTAALTHP
jgi:hypothetical protein